MLQDTFMTTTSHDQGSASRLSLARAQACSTREGSSMNITEVTAHHWGALLDSFAAELTDAVLPVASRHGEVDSSVALELDLWKVLTNTVKTKGCKLLRAAFPERSELSEQTC